jgi:hypothetical protein
MRIRDPGRKNKDSGWKKGRSGKKIPNPQHWLKKCRSGSFFPFDADPDPDPDPTSSYRQD